MSEERASRVTSTQSVSSNTAEELNRAEDLKTRGAIYPRPEGLGFLASKDKESRKIVDQYQYICIEDLNIRKMVEGSYLAKSITDASWNQFRQFLTYKAVEAGRKLGVVNPAYTTQTCNRCQNRAVKTVSEREHCCGKCGYQVSRDLNAAQNILALGLDGLGEIPRSPRLKAGE